MAEKKVVSQSVNLTPNHYKLGLAMSYVHVKGVPYIVGKLSTRATTLR
jgi:hypothetical protein